MHKNLFKTHHHIYMCTSAHVCYSNDNTCDEMDQGVGPDEETVIQEVVDRLNAPHASSSTGTHTHTHTDYIHVHEKHARF